MLISLSHTRWLCKAAQSLLHKHLSGDWLDDLCSLIAQSVTEMITEAWQGHSCRTTGMPTDATLLNDDGTMKMDGATMAQGTFSSCD